MAEGLGVAWVRRSFVPRGDLQRCGPEDTPYIHKTLGAAVTTLVLVYSYTSPLSSFPIIMPNATYTPNLLVHRNHIQMELGRFVHGLIKRL